MRKVLLSAAMIAVLAGYCGIAPARAQGAIGAGFQFGNANTVTGAFTRGTAAAGSVGAANVQSIGTGFSVTGPGPIGTTSAAIGASAGSAGTLSGAASFGNGVAITGANANTVGAGVGFANRLP